MNRSRSDPSPHPPASRKYRNARAVAGMCLLALAGFAAHAETARGIVFHDRNGNGLRDAGEKGLARVAVSNGREVVETAGDGSYALPVTDDTAIFVIRPANWNVPLQPGTQLPQHYYLHEPNGSPESRYPGVAPTGPLPDSIDFPLTRAKGGRRFRVLLFGDTQTRDQREVDFTSHDILEEVWGTEAAFGLTLGDIVYDDLDMFRPIAQAIGVLGLPWHHVIGNHDLNQDAKSTQHSDETYESVFGPAWYAFNHGEVHFVVLSDALWNPIDRRYSPGLGERQVEFLRNDLALVPRNKLVVLLMHIPIVEVAEREQVYAMLAAFPHTFSISAHWHRQEQFFLDADDGWPGPGQHHHLVAATACGSWWQGRLDELGIPSALMWDGTPNGYSLVTFDGTDYSVRFHAARRPAGYQMNVYAPEAVPAGDVGGTEVVVNVFAGSERSTVEMRFGEDGAWVPLERFEGEDPLYARMRVIERDYGMRIARLKQMEGDGIEVERAAVREFLPYNGRELPEPRQDVRHLWRGRLPAGLSPAPGSYVIHVRTTDLYGQTWQARRVLRVEAAQAD